MTLAIPYPVEQGIRGGMAFSAVVDADGRANPSMGRFHLLQDAIDSQHEGIFVRPGTYSEVVTIASGDAVRVIMGAGEGVVIDGGTSGHALTCSKAGVLLIGLSAQTTALGGNSFDGFVFDAARVKGRALTVIDSDRYAFRFTGNGDNSSLIGCESRGSDNQGIAVDSGGNYCCIVGNTIRGWATAWITDSGTGTIFPTASNITTA